RTGPGPGDPGGADRGPHRRPTRRRAVDPAHRTGRRPPARAVLDVCTSPRGPGPPAVSGRGVSHPRRAWSTGRTGSSTVPGRSGFHHDLRPSVTFRDRPSRLSGGTHVQKWGFIYTLGDPEGAVRRDVIGSAACELI